MKKHIQHKHAGTKLYDQITSEKPAKKPHLCDICNASFADSCGVKRHIAQVHEKKRPYSCHICSLTFLREGDKNRHIAQVHEGKKPHVCNICAKCFSRKSHLNVHALVHEKSKDVQKSFNCPICNMNLSSKRNLENHVAKVHDGKSNIFSNKNSTNFNESNIGPKYEETIESLEFPESDIIKHEPDVKIDDFIKCEPAMESNQDIESSIYETNDLEYHTYEANIVEYNAYETSNFTEESSAMETNCYEEDYITESIKVEDYETKPNIAELNTEFLENTKSYICNICSAEFLQIEDLEKHSTEHIVKVHKEKAKNPQNSKIKTKLGNKVRKKKHFCEICNAKFSNGSDVKRHFEQVHEKKRPYSCDICSTSFSRESDKTKHIEEVHEGKKPHVCDICEKCFSRKNHLNVHINAVHEKAEKKNVCDLCDYR